MLAPLSLLKLSIDGGLRQGIASERGQAAG